MLTQTTNHLNFIQGSFKPFSYRQTKYRQKINQQTTDFQQTMKFASYIGLKPRQHSAYQQKIQTNFEHKNMKGNKNFIGFDASKIIKTSITNRRITYFDIKSLVQKRKRIDTLIQVNEQFQKHQRNFSEESRVSSAIKNTIAKQFEEDINDYQKLRVQTARELTRKQRSNKIKHKNIQQFLERQNIDRSCRSKILNQIAFDKDNCQENEQEVTINYCNLSQKTNKINQSQKQKSINWKEWNASITNQSSNLNASPYIVSNISQSFVFEKQPFCFRPSKIIRNKNKLDLDKKGNNSMRINNQSFKKIQKQKNALSKSVMIKANELVKKNIQLKINRKNSKCFQFKYKICAKC